MSELTIADEGRMIGPDMTRQEANEAADTFIAHGNKMRWLLLDMFERNAHKALHYSKFEDFAAERLSLFYSKEHFSRLMSAARVERSIFPVDKFINSPKPKLSIPAALELAKLPSAEMQKDAYGQMEVLREHGMRTEREYHIGLKKLVAQMLKREETAKSESSPGLPASRPIQDTPPSNDFGESIAPPKRESPKPQTVKGYTPPADPEPVEEQAELFESPECPDPDELQICFDTAMVWARNGEIADAKRIREKTRAVICAFLAWEATQ